MSKSELHRIVDQGVDLAESTRTRYLRDLDTWIAFAGADPANWTSATAQSYYSFLLGRMTAQSANRSFAAVAYAARWWANELRRPELNFTIIRKPKIEPDETTRHALTEDQAKKLLDVCAGKHPISLRDTAMIVVELETGMRRMSLRSMTFETLDISSSNPAGYPIARVLSKGHQNVRQPVPMSDTALMAIARWQEFLDRKRGPIFVALQKTADLKSGKNVFTPSKTALSEQAINKIIAGRGDEIGLHIYPHMFRHTYVTWRMQAGLLPHEVAAVTGHDIKNLGALGGYIDMRAIGEKARRSTPEWLRKRFE